LLVEVIKTKVPSGLALIYTFADKIALFRAENPGRSVLAGFLSLGGFTEEAIARCRELGIGTATAINDIHEVWP